MIKRGQFNKQKWFLIIIAGVMILSFIKITLITATGFNMDQKTDNNETVITNYYLAEKIIKGNDSQYNYFYSTFNDNKSFKPLLLPKNLSLTPNLMFEFTNYQQTEGYSYGNLYQENKLIYQETRTLLAVYLDILNGTTSLKNLVTDCYKSHVWFNRVNIETTDEGNSYYAQVVLKSPITVVNQVWNAWISWRYDNKGVCFRSEIIIWLINATELSNFNPYNNNDLKNIPVYFKFIWEDSSSRLELDSLVTLLLMIGGGITSLVVSPFLIIGFIFLNTPTKKIMLKDKIILEINQNYSPEKDQVVYFDNYGYKKFTIGLLITIVPLIIAPFDNSGFSRLVIIAGFGWFGYYLLMKTLKEMLGKYTIKKTPTIIGVSILLIITGTIYGIIPLIDYSIHFWKITIGLMNDFFVLIGVMTSIGMCSGYILIYESFYKTQWLYNKTTDMFIIKKYSLISKLEERLPLQYINSITMDKINYKRKGMIKRIINIVIKGDKPKFQLELTFDFLKTKRLTDFYKITSILIEKPTILV